MSATKSINTVTGITTAAGLGRTLMHEHLMIGYPGWESDTLHPGAGRQEMLSVCCDRIEEIKSHGVSSMLDPCPNDLGRDVEFMAEVAARADFTIICATGLYKEDQGGAAYWKFRADFGGGAESIAEMYIKELTEGIGPTGIKAGIIKVATGSPAISDYERMLLEAAAIAAKETGAPITTHTDSGVLGDEQQKILVAAGLPASRIIIGHSCGSADTGYHLGILEGGSYLGFDRFGLEVLQPDDLRVASLLKLLAAGHGHRIVVSHDSVWCWRGEPVPDPKVLEVISESWNPCHFFNNIIPRLKDGGASDQQIEALLVDNPRRFFSGQD